MQSKLKTSTVLFSDIRNFTRLTRELGALQVINLLNKYLETMACAIEGHNGVLHKFMGDAIMAVFGLPVARKFDAKNAVQCGLQMIEVLEELSKNSAFDNKLHIGIGISSGSVVSGIIGSKNRSEYTVIGDAVNLASRLENETKKFKVDILICEDTYNFVSPHFHCREIDTVSLKGINDPVKIYTVIKDKKVPYSYKEALLTKNYALGLQCYYNQNYKQSFEYFKTAYFYDMTDGPTEIFLDRCINLILSNQNFISANKQLGAVPK